jgi:hypothetical protein
VARALLFVALCLGCTRSPPPQAVADPQADAPRPIASSEHDLSLPLVSGCGCAYQCAHGVREGAGGVWDVTHDFQDSATLPAVIELWCFDDKGHGYPQKAAPKEATLCRRVFYDRTPCGGECIPSTKYLRCEK